jgi:two-component system, sensor histidine kinase LadS
VQACKRKKVNFLPIKYKYNQGMMRFLQYWSSRYSPSKFLAALSLYALMLVPASVLAQEPTAQERAPILVFGNTNDLQGIGESLEYFEDKSAALTFADIHPRFGESKYLRQFQPSHSKVPNFGVTRSAFWVRFRLRRPLSSTLSTPSTFSQSSTSGAESSRQLYVQLSNSLLNNVHFYAATSDADTATFVEEHHLPIADRSSPMWLYHLYTIPAFRPQSQTGSSFEQEIYMRIEGRSPLIVALTICDLSGALNRERWRLWIHAMFLGILTVMTLYNFFVGLSMRSLAYVWYVLYGVSTFFYVSHQSGLTQAYFGTAPMRFWVDHFATLGLLSAMPVILFGISFLEIKQRAPRMYKVLVGVLLCEFGLVVLEFTGDSGLILSHRLTPPIITLGALISFGTALYLAFRGVREARFYCVAWAGWIACIVTLILMGTGIIEVSRLIEFLTHGAATSELVFMSFALADKLNVLRAANAVLLVEKNQHLETVVQERTAALEASNQALATTNTMLQQTNSTLAEANAELDSTNNVKSRMISVVSHDLKNPLNAVIGLASVAEMKTQTSLKSGAALASADMNEIAVKVRSNGELMLKLIHDLLDFAAQERQDMRITAEPMNLAELLARVVEQHQPSADAKLQTIKLYTPQKYWLDGDYDRLRQVFDNLLSNAVKYSTVQSEILVVVTDAVTDVVGADVASMKAAGVRVCVIDAGQGFTSEDKAQAFQMFQKLSARPTAGEHSSGVGLAIVKQIVELHGGNVRIEDRAAASHIPDLRDLIDTSVSGAMLVVELPKSNR